MKKRNFYLKAVFLMTAALLVICNLVLGETLSVTKIQDKYGIKFITEGDKLTFEVVDTLKAVVTDTVKIQECMKEPYPAKDDNLIMIYQGEGYFILQWKEGDKTLTAMSRFSPSIFEMLVK